MDPFLYRIIKDVEEGWIGKAYNAVAEFLGVFMVQHRVEALDEGHVHGVLVMVELVIYGELIFNDLAGGCIVVGVVIRRLDGIYTPFWVRVLGVEGI